MKITTSDVKKWTVLKIDGELFRVMEITHSHTWRGSANNTYKVKNIITWATNSFTYKSWTTLEKAEVITKAATYLYSDGENYYFMENDNAEIHAIPYDTVEDIVPFLKENLDVYMMVYEWKVIGVILPQSITYVVKETVEWVKWDRASAGRKPATLETWMQVMVPLHIEQWDEVKVSTATGEVT